MTYFFDKKKEQAEEEERTDREMLLVAVDELYEFTVGEVDREGPTVISRRLTRLAERIEKHLTSKNKED